MDYYIGYAVISLEERLPEFKKVYSAFITTEDPYIKSVAEALQRAAIRDGYGYYDTANFILAFVQSLPYIPDDVSTPYDEFPKFPLETLIEGGGDCEDTSILYATLLKILGYDVVLWNPPGHMMVGVGEYGGEIPDGGWHVEYEGEKYYLAETTGEGWVVGEAPREFQHQTGYTMRITGEQIRPRYTDTPKLIKEYEALKEEYNTLSKDYLDLKYRLSDLQSAYTSLEASYKSLQEDYKIAFMKLEDVQDRYEALEEEFNNLNDRFNRLRSDYDTLSQKYQSLKTSYDELYREYEALKSTFSLYTAGFYLLLIVAIILLTLLVVFRARYRHSTPSQVLSISMDEFFDLLLHS